MNTQSKGILPLGDCEERLRRAGKRAAAERDTKRAGAVVGAASDSLDIVEVKARLGSSASDLHDEQVPSDTASIGATFGRIGCDVVGDCHIPNIESLRVQLLRGEPEVQDVPSVVTEEHQGSSAVVGIDDNGSDLRGGWGREDVSAHSAVRHPGSYPPGEGWVMARPPADNNRNLLRGTDGRPDHTAVHLLDICGKCPDETTKTFGGEIARVVKQVCQEMLHCCWPGRHRQDRVRAAGRTAFGRRPAIRRRQPASSSSRYLSRPALLPTSRNTCVTPQGVPVHCAQACPFPPVSYTHL